MESVEIDRDVSESDITGVREADHRTLNTVVPDDGNDCGISKPAPEVLVEKRTDDATVRPMGHLIPGFIGLEEGFASSASPLKQRFRNLQPLSQAVELTDRVAALARSIHLQLDERDLGEDLSATNSSRTVDSPSNRRNRGHRQRSDARARRRERLNSDSSMSTSQWQLNSRGQIYSSGLSSPEPATLREIRKDPTERMRRFSALVNDQFDPKDDPMVDATREALPTNLSIEMTDGSFCSVPNKPASSSPSFVSADCPFVTRRKTPMKFGGYRPASGLMFRNPSSDSESDAAFDRFVRRGSSKRIFRYKEAGDVLPCDSKDRKMIRGSEFAWSNSYCSTPERIAEATSLPVQKFEALENELRSPAQFARSRNSLDRFKSFSGPQFPEETHWTPVEDARNPEDSDIENSVDKKEDIHENEPCNSFFSKELAAASTDSRDGNLGPQIPKLEIDSQGHSQSHSPSPECKGETIASSLDVRALIRALSSVSLKQEELEKRRTRPTMREKSPLEYVNRFSGSSRPRSSEYTPAADPGSRQSLTSVEVSEAHSLIKASKVDPKAQGRSSLSLKWSERNARSHSITPEASAGLSRRSLPGLKKVPIVGSLPVDDPAVDRIQANDFIPVIAKVNRTNLICPKHPPEIKPMGKLIPPRKYPSRNFSEEIEDKPLTSRTTVSQSSEGSRRGFSSVKSIPRVTKLHVKKIDGSQLKTKNSCLSAPLSGRRVLEPLNLVPKIQENTLSTLSRKFERRRKIASELNAIISGQRETIERKISPRVKKSPQNRTSRTESFDSGSLQRPKKLIFDREKKSPDSRRKSSSPDKEVSSGARTPKERRLLKRRRPATEKQDRKSVGHPFQEEEGFESSKRKSADNLDGKNGDNSNDHSQNEKSVFPIAFRGSRCGGNSFKEIEVFKQLPNVICASLTRHSSLKTPIIESLNDDGEMTSAIIDLKKSVRGGRRWNRRSEPDNDFENSNAGNEKCDLDKVLSSKSLTSFKGPQSRGSFTSQTKIPVKITLAAANNRRQKNVEVEEKPSSEANFAPGKIYPPSTFHKGESAHDDTEAGQPDSRSLSLAHSSSSSHWKKNYHEEVGEEKLAEKTIKSCEIESSGFEEEQNGNSDTELISSVDVRDTKSLERIYRTQLSPSKSNGEKRSPNSSRVALNCQETLTSAISESASCAVAVEERRIAEVLEDEESRLTNGDNRQPENVNSIKFGDSGLGICEKSSERSAKSQNQLRLDDVEKSLSSTSKWNVTVANTVRKSQDRFPFTISESASRKTSRFKIVQDVSLDELLREEISPKKILAKSEDETRSLPTETELLTTTGPNSQKDPVLSLDKLADKIADDSMAKNWNSDSPMTKVNYVFYGSKEEPRTLMPAAVKGMVKKFSARLGRAKTGRKQNPEETAVRILYRNNRCHGESGEGSSSATSLHHSQLLCNKLASTSVRGSAVGSRGSTGKGMKAKKINACTSVSLHHTPRKSSDRNDLWVQEFDSDVDFESVIGPANSEGNLANTGVNPANRNRYSMFFAKCKTAGIIENVENERVNKSGCGFDRWEAGDTRNIAERKEQNDVDETKSKSPKTPANSYDDEFRIKETELDELRDSSGESGCCCFRICHFFTYSLREEVKSAEFQSSKKRRRIKIWNKNKKK